jgi:hypothetical protein
MHTFPIEYVKATNKKPIKIDLIGPDENHQ